MFNLETDLKKNLDKIKIDYLKEIYNFLAIITKFCKNDHLNGFSC